MVGFTIFCFRNWSLHDTRPGVPHRGGRPALVPIGGRSSRPPAEREALNLVLDVLAQLLEDAFDVLGRAVIGKRP